MSKKSLAIAVSSIAMLAVSALPVFATDSMMAQTTAQNLACVQTAVDKREAAVGTAYDTYTTSIKTALATRKTALHNAWGVSEAKTRRLAIRDAWSAFRKSHKDARAAWHTARRSAWKTFETERRACKVPNSGVENSAVDASL